MRRTLCFIVLFAFALTFTLTFTMTAIACARAFAAPLSPRYAVWSEFADYDAVEGQLDWLRSRNIELYLAVVEAESIPEGFFRIWNKAKAKGVTLRPWLLLNREHGYWSNKWNASHTEAWINYFLLQMRQRNLETQWIILDLEPPAPLLEALSRSLGQGNLGDAVEALRRSSKDGSIQSAKYKYNELVQNLHSRGIRVHAVTHPLVLHDLSDHDLRIQSALGIPLQGIDWDEVSFMAYRPEWQRMIGPIGADIVFRYAQRARLHFQDRASIDLGEVGFVAFPIPFWGYASPSSLSDDIAASLAAGVNRIHVYSLDGMASMAAEEKNLWFPHLLPQKPQSETKAWVFEATIDFLRSLLPAMR